IVDDETVAGIHKPAGHGNSHIAEADEPDSVAHALPSNARIEFPCCCNIRRATRRADASGLRLVFRNGLTRRAESVDTGGDAGIDCYLQQNLLNLFLGTAVAQGALNVTPQFMR